MKSNFFIHRKNNKKIMKKNQKEIIDTREEELLSIIQKEYPDLFIEESMLATSNHYPMSFNRSQKQKIKIQHRKN